MIGALKDYIRVQDSISDEKDKLISNLLQREKNFIQQSKDYLEKEKLFLQQISLLNKDISFANRRISELSDEKLDIQKARSNNGIYVLGEFGNGISITDVQTNLKLEYKHLFVGFQYVKSKTIFSFKVNPLNSEMVYAGSVSFKIW